MESNVLIAEGKQTPHNGEEQRLFALIIARTISVGIRSLSDTLPIGCIIRFEY
jgi:hypothetical protein